MKKIILFNLLLLMVLGLQAQNSIEVVIAEIEKNNTTLMALKKRSEAETIGNKSGITIPDPEAEFNYLWGSPGNIGNRTDFSIKQSMDFPTAYRFKNQISDLKNEQVLLEYQKALYAIRLQAKKLCFDVIYYNALIEELTRRESHARQIAQSYQTKFDTGETNILEYNKAQLNLLNASKTLESKEVELNAQLAELSRLNGGIKIEMNEKKFQPVMLASGFDQWILQAEQQNPMLAWIKKEIEISRKQESLNKAMGFPKLQAGYMSESLVGEQFQGVTFGLSIPLWENKNRVKYAKANSLALESLATDNKLQFYTQLKALYNKAADLQQNVAGYREGLSQYYNTAFLKTALDKGEISLINYINEFSFYYESINNLLVTERELSKLNAELNQFTK
ncbi:MAG: TolC family protein [Bacteroidetes bacterium]|nr:TolC family protein [Bacteroidota bacterium]MBU1578331.1 TolC family protein [Bacteroidota bacterium]MBU2556746.1 TolC family protein [Bacteroidota bacterium]